MFTALRLVDGEWRTTGVYEEAETDLLDRLPKGRYAVCKQIGWLGLFPRYRYVRLVTLGRYKFGCGWEV